MTDPARIELLRPVRIAGHVVEPCAEMTLPLPDAAALVHVGKARYLPDVAPEPLPESPTESLAPIDPPPPADVADPVVAD